MKYCVGIIIENGNGEYLMQLRDERPKEYPLHWTLFGGQTEKNESAAEAIRREIKEEIGFDIENARQFKVYIHEDRIHQTIFHKKVDVDLKKLTLNEGKDMKFFTKKDVLCLRLAFNIKNILLDKFNEDQEHIIEYQNND